MSFPLNSNDPYIKPTGERSTLGAEIGSGGGGGGGLPEYDETDAGKVLSVDNEGDLVWNPSVGTPDYEHDILIIGTHEDFEYYVTMSKRYVGDAIPGYAIKTNPGSSMQAAKIDVYSLIYAKDSGEIIDSTLIKTLTHNGDSTYSNDFISITYNSDGAKWSVTMLQTMYNTSGVAYTSPLEWSYNTEVDYTLLTADPTATT